jgi:hypothetical protein
MNFLTSACLVIFIKWFANILTKNKFIIKEIMDNISFWKWERKKKSSQIFVFGLQYVTINIKGWLNIYIPYSL